MSTRELTHLQDLGFSHEEATALRRISRRLQRLYTRECNDSSDKRSEIPALIRTDERWLAAILASHPALQAYLQTDPRGPALYILRPGDVPEGEDAERFYTRGVAV